MKNKLNFMQPQLLNFLVVITMFLNNNNNI